MPKEAYFVPKEVADKRFYPTWDDPAKYAGEQVEAWPPGKDRNMTTYLKPETAIDSPCSEEAFAAREDVRLLVAIKSGPLKFEERMTNRYLMRIMYLAHRIARMDMVLKFPTKLEHHCG